MKHFLKIVFSLWIISGLAAGTGIAFAQNLKTTTHSSLAVLDGQKQQPKVIGDVCHESGNSTVLECERELEDNTEKLFDLPESTTCNYEFYFRHLSLSSLYCEKTLTRSLNILYCIYRI